MIRFEDVSVTYAGRSEPALRNVTAQVDEGELCLVIGPTGAGKSTLLRAACGLTPHFTGGLLTGRVLIDGRDTRHHRPRDLADVVGVVGQDPLAGFVTDSVEEELAYGMEQLGLSPAVMRTRVEEVVDLLGLGGLRTRPLADLSGGEQQRVALGAVMTSQPRILVLDEPTSALDPAAAEDVLAAITRLVHDLGLTVLLAEHRLERVVQYADRVISLSSDGDAVHGLPPDILLDSQVAPPIVELGRLAGWRPVPLSVRDARRRAAPLRARLAEAGGPLETGPSTTTPAAAPYVGTPNEAAIATLDVYAQEGLFQRARGLESYWQEAAHSLNGARHVIDVRNLGLVAGIELEPRPGAPGRRAMELFHACFDEGLLIRVTADIVALSPPLIVSEAQIDEMIGKLGEVLARTA